MQHITNKGEVSDNFAMHRFFLFHRISHSQMVSMPTPKLITGCLDVIDPHKSTPNTEKAPTEVSSVNVLTLTSIYGYRPKQ